MNLYLTFSDLDRTHRIGHKKTYSNKPRALIIKSVSSCMSKIIFQIKNG